jgi:hypothetical protein
MPQFVVGSSALRKAQMPQCVVGSSALKKTQCALMHGWYISSALAKNCPKMFLKVSGLQY